MPLNMIPQLSRPYDSMFQPMPQEQPFPTNLQSIGDLTGTLQGMTARAGNEQDRAPVLIQQNADRTSTIKNVPPETLKFHDTASKFYMQALGQYSQEAQRLQIQEEEARRHPLLGALTNIAGNLGANDPTLPGWVRALGASSLQLNPRPDDIARQRLAVTAAGAGIAEKAAEMGTQAQQLGLQASALGIKQEDEKRKEDALTLRAQKDLQHYHATILTPWMQAAMRGDIQPGQGRMIAEQLKMADMPIDQAGQAGRNLESASQAANDAKAAKEAATDAREKAKLEATEKWRMAQLGVALMKIVTSQTDKGAERQKTEDIKLAGKEFETERVQIRNADYLSQKAGELDKLLRVAIAKGAVVDPVTGKPTKYDPAIGVVKGREPILMLNHMDGYTRAKFITLSAALNDAVIKAKARYWTPMEQQNLADKIPTKEKPLDFNLGALQEINEAARGIKRDSIRSAVHVNWFDPKTSSVLGDQRDDLLKEHASNLSMIDPSLVPESYRAKIATPQTQAPTAAPAYKEGDVLVNPQGHKIMLKNNQWVPVP